MGHRTNRCHYRRQDHHPNHHRYRAAVWGRDLAMETGRGLGQEKGWVKATGSGSAMVMATEKDLAMATGRERVAVVVAAKVREAS
jgi:hypothetical protein